MSKSRYTDNGDTLEIILNEGESQPFCPYRKQSCTRECSHWLNEDIGCSSLCLQDDPEAVFAYYAKMEEENEMAI